MSGPRQLPAGQDAASNGAGGGLDVLLTNNATLNTGDAAILLATMRVLGHAFGDKTRFTVCDKQPEVAARYYPEISFRPWPYANGWRPRRVGYVGRLLRGLNRLRHVVGVRGVRRGRRLLPRLTLTPQERSDAIRYASADLVVSTGGTYLVENYSLEPPLFDYRLTRLSGRPLVLFTQSLGPFTTRRNIAAFRRVFSSTELILLRDERSRHHLRALDLTGIDVGVSADTAFALADGEVLERARSGGPRRDRQLRVAISVRHWPHFTRGDPELGMQRYRRAVRALTAHLVETLGAEITFISTCQGVPEYWTDDSHVAREIVDGLPPHVQNHVSVDEEFHRPEQLIDLLGKHDLAISTRMHLAILALCSGVPVLPISYEFKTEQLFARLGLGRWVQDIEEVTERALPDALDDFLDALPGMRGELFSRVRAERDRALESGALAREAYERWLAATSGVSRA